MSTTFFRRRIAPLAAAGLAVALLAGCSAGAADGPSNFVFEPGDDIVEIDFWSAAVEDVNQEMADNFNATRGEELGIKVNVTYQGDYFETEQKVYAAQLADTMPNVFVDEVGMTSSFTKAGVTLDLDPYLEANGMDDEDFQIGATDNLYVDDAMRAFPYMRSVPVMYVNRGLLEQHGFNPEGPETLEELSEILRTVSAVTGKPSMLLPNYDLWVMEALWYSYGGVSVLNEDETASNLAAPGAIVTAEWLSELIEDGAVRHTGPAEVQEVFAMVGDPEIAISLTSSGAIKSFQELAAGKGIDLGVSMFPAGDNDQRGVSVGGSNLYVTTAGTDHERAAAFEFARWATDTEQAAFTSAWTGYVAVRASAQDTELLKKTFAENPAYEVATEQLSFGRARPMAESYSEVQQLIIERIGTMWAQGQDPKDAMTSLASEVDAVLAR